MIVAVADTHTIVWCLFQYDLLSSRCRDFLEKTAAENNQIAVATISLVEIVYLIEKRRLAPEVYPAVRIALADPEQVFIEAVLSAGVADALSGISRLEIPDMPDRIVAATAVQLKVPVITRDERIRSSPIQTIW
jgi:PIN domain nuclease of toxin-antitoxin system